MPISDVIKKPRWQYSIAIPIFLAALLSRRPDVFLNPQFWAEDGRNWYADAYNYGFFHSVATPEAGYLQTFSRLIASISTQFPLEYAPTFFNCVALIVQLTVAVFILSPRLAPLMPRMRWRAVLAFLYIAMPHSFEIYGNVTNSQWHLALLTLLIILAKPAETQAGKLFDLSVLALSVLSGPFCILLLPIAGIKYIVRREKGLIPILGFLTAGAVLQATALLTSVRPVQPDLGADVWLLFEIAGRHLFLGPIIGGKLYARSEAWPVVQTLMLIVANTAGIGLLIYAARTASLELRLFMLFCLIIVAAALYSPAVASQPGQWRVIAENNTAIRYWFIPTVCAYFLLLNMVAGKVPSLVRGVALAAILLIPAGLFADWRHPAFVDLDFAAHARRFDELSPGTTAEIPINPNWRMTLVKK